MSWSQQEQVQILEKIVVMGVEMSVHMLWRDLFDVVYILEGLAKSWPCKNMKIIFSKKKRI